MDAPDWRILQDPVEISAIAATITRVPTPLTAEEVALLVAFLDSLTDPAAIDGRLGIPDAVPSGLPVAQVPQDALVAP